MTRVRITFVGGRPNRAPQRRASLAACLAAVAALTAVPSAAQGPAQVVAGPAPLVLTLDEALRLAEERSEQVAIATAGVTRARAGEQRARSERFPQVFGSASYDRSLASEFEGLFDGASSTCTPLQVDPGASLEDRVTELERAYSCPASSTAFAGGDGEALPFGRPNTYRLGLAFTQALYAGGRIVAQERQATLGRQSAEVSLRSSRAQLALDVARAYFDAALSDRLVAIAQATYDQADRAFEQTRLQREAGRVAEFEQLRAQVARDTLSPNVIRAKSNREIAYLQLRQLLEIPLAVELELVAPLDEDAPPAERFREGLAEIEAGTTPRRRAALDSAANDVLARQESVRIARSQRLPSVGVNSIYGLVSYPEAVPGFDAWRTNWTVGATLQVPLFTGGRVAAEEAIARAEVEESQQRLVLARELAALDAESAGQELVAARATWDASSSTVAQAQRAYDIAELRYREGLSTQLELSDARLLLQQAQANRAQAARDLQLARVRLVLLPELPLTTPGASGLAAQGQRVTTALTVTPATSAASAPGGATTNRTSTGAVR